MLRTKRPTHKQTQNPQHATEQARRRTGERTHEGKATSTGAHTPAKGEGSTTKPEARRGEGENSTDPP